MSVLDTARINEICHNDNSGFDPAERNANPEEPQEMNSVSGVNKRNKSKNSINPNKPIIGERTISTETFKETELVSLYAEMAQLKFQNVALKNVLNQLSNKQLKEMGLPTATPTSLTQPPKTNKYHSSSPTKDHERQDLKSHAFIHQKNAQNIRASSQVQGKVKTKEDAISYIQHLAQELKRKNVNSGENSIHLWMKNKKVHPVVVTEPQGRADPFDLICQNGGFMCKDNGDPAMMDISLMYL